MEVSTQLLAIIKYELSSLLKSIKSIIIIIFFTLITFLTSKFFAHNEFIMSQDHSDSVYTSTIKFLFFFLGFIFIAAVSHDILNKDIEMETIRFLVAKTSRLSIILGKFFGVYIFWMLCLSVCFFITFLFSGKWPLYDYLSISIFLFYAIAFTFLLSITIPKPSLTMLLGIILGFIIPILGIVATFKSNIWYLLPFKYILPYFYILKTGFFMLIPLFIGFLLISISLVMLKRKDL